MGFYLTQIRSERLENESKGKTQYGDSPFMDLSPKEFEHSYLMPKKFHQKENIPEEIRNNVMKFNFTEKPKLDKDSRIPGMLGWSTSCLTGIYNQGSCGSCWDFSATEQIESMNCIQGHTGGTAVSLSMQQVLDCDHVGTDGCGGGSTYSAYNYVISQGGIDTYASYPYVGTQQACRYNPNNVGARISAWGWITQDRDEQVMHNYLFDSAPISICVCASQWQYYSGGVVMGTNCCTAIDHCVQIVGYWQISGVWAWAVRNEWGASWGDHGYIYLQYGTNTCGCAEYPSTVNTT